MKSRYWWIVLAYGTFLGWLLVFPYNGPVLKALASEQNLQAAPFSLTYTVIPVLFLIAFSIFTAKEKYSRRIMLGSILVCLTGTVLIFVSGSFWWYPLLGVMGICSVMYIISWSTFYTRGIPVQQKMQVMALVIVVGNLLYYLLNLALPYLALPAVLLTLTGLLLLSLWTSLRIQVDYPIEICLEKESFPTSLIAIVCLFLFVIKINGGLTFHTIYPYFEETFGRLSSYYGILPYIFTLLILIYWGNKIDKMVPVYIGTALLGLAYLSFSAFDNIVGYFITNTFLQAGWALLQLFWWTLFGEIASIYGRPMKICSLAFLSNLLAMFLGGVLAVYVLPKTDNYYMISIGYAISILFVSFLVVHLLNGRIEKDFLTVLHRKSVSQHSEEERKSDNYNISQIVNMEWVEQTALTAREIEVAQLLVQGYTNKAIAQKLCITENTMKTHARNIYSKLSISNKRELLHQACIITASTRLDEKPQLARSRS